jgi:hypothetical protein
MSTYNSSMQTPNLRRQRGDDYELVEKFPVSRNDSKANIDDDQKRSFATSLTMPMAKMIGSKLGKYRTHTAIRFPLVGSSNSFVGTIQALTPNSSSVTEAAGFAATFDEMRVHGVDVLCRVSSSVQVVTPNVAWALVYDPANTGSYSSVVGACVSSQYIGPVSLTHATDGGITPVTSSGYIRKTFVVPPASLTPIPGAANPSVGQSWIATTDTASNVGYLKLAVDALGSGVSAEIDIFVIYDVEYRSRT